MNKIRIKEFQTEDKANAWLDENKDIKIIDINYGNRGILIIYI